MRFGSLIWSYVYSMHLACVLAGENRPMAASTGDTPPYSFKIGTAARAAGSVSSGRQPVVSCQREAAGACCVVNAELRRWLCWDVWPWTRRGMCVSCLRRRRRATATNSTSPSTAPRMRSRAKRRASWCGRTSSTRYAPSTGWLRTTLWWVDRSLSWCVM